MVKLRLARWLHSLMFRFNLMIARCSLTPTQHRVPFTSYPTEVLALFPRFCCVCVEVGLFSLQLTISTRNSPPSEKLRPSIKHYQESKKEHLPKSTSVVRSLLTFVQSPASIQFNDFAILSPTLAKVPTPYSTRTHHFNRIPILPTGL